MDKTDKLVLPKIAYIHGRPGAHPMHARLAKSIGGISHFVDFRLRWHDKNVSPVRRYVSWLICALTFPKSKDYDIFLANGPHYMVILMRILKVITSRQKIVIHLASEVLYFLYSDWYSTRNKRLLLQVIKRADALVCEGTMAAQLVDQLLVEEAPKKYITFLGVPSERYNKLMGIVPNFNLSNIIILANGPTEFRKWYKGLDLMFEAFVKARTKINNLTLTVVGDWDEEIKQKLLIDVPDQVQQSIRFVGKVNNIDTYLAQSFLCLHCTRGDAFPTSTLETMAAGIIPIVSEWTGAKEVIEKVDNNFIVPLDPDLISEKINWFYQLPLEEKKRFSDRAREVVQDYTEEKAIKHYQNTFKKIAKDFDM